MVGEKHIGHDSKYRYVYLISNKVNGKTYVGQHTTEDLNDNYFGSGLLLKRAIKKYGKEKYCCPHCNKSSVNKAMMMRWHFDNCKLK
jgi:hypothetical protein